MPPKKIREQFKISETSNPGGSLAWRISGTNSKGNRIREQYGSLAEAKQRRLDLEHEEDDLKAETQLLRTRLNEDQLRVAENASSLAGARPLTDIVRDYLDLRRRAAMHDLTPSEAMAYFERHYTPELEELSIYTGVERFNLSRSERRDKTQATYRTALNLLIKELDPNTPLQRIDLPILEKILQRYPNPNSRKTYKRSWHTFFEWCLKRRHVLENPVKRMDSIEGDRSEISILSLDEIKRLLTAAMLWKEGRFAPVVALGLFAGLRPSEIEDLKPSEINNTHIMVRGGKLRRTHKRRVPIQPVLAEWLKEYPFKNYPAAMKTNLRHLKDATKAVRWVQDIIRHTSISYQLERDKDEKGVAFNNGTSVAMLDAHYRQVVETDKEVSDFWELTPAKTQALKLKIKLPQEKRSIEWPTKRKLATLVWKRPVSQIAKEFGVSDVAVRKHCLTLGLDLPARGYWQKKRTGSGRVTQTGPEHVLAWRG